MRKEEAARIQAEEDARRADEQKRIADETAEKRERGSKGGRG